jgi:hypothetical protein
MDKVNLELVKITRAEEELRDEIYKEEYNSFKLKSYVSDPGQVFYLKTENYSN